MLGSSSTMRTFIRLPHGRLELDPEGHTASVAGEEVSLTYREFDVLCYLARNRRRVIGREELLENIWGYSYTGNTRAVDILVQLVHKVHLAHIAFAG